MERRSEVPFVYLDHAATTPVRPEVREAMAPFASELFANASSAYGPGRRARQAVEEARDEVAACVGAEPAEVVFTSGGTEADNLAVVGLVAARAEGGQPIDAVCSAMEHAAVLAPLRALAGRGSAPPGGGVRLHEVGVTPRGLVDLEQLQ